MKPGGRRATVLGSLAESVRSVHEAHEGSRWPSPRWADDPIGFARTILGVELWSFQEDFLLSIRDHRHVAVAGGRKIGKDFACAVAALWWYASFENSRVFFLAPTSKQLDGILYRETRMLFGQSGRCLDCRRADPAGPSPCPHSSKLTGKVGMLARNGIKDGFREIVGMTAVNEGGLRGMSGARILAIEDEASEIKDDFDTALVGNLAGADCHRVLISNPTKVWGFFHRAFHQERDLYRLLQVSTESNPNIVEGTERYRGLADRLWIREREIAWGRGSMNWAANVEGRFPRAEEGQLFDLEMITLASARWDEASTEGRLQLGIDIAGEGQEGDETAFCIRRGFKVLDSILTRRGITPDAILETARGILNQHRNAVDAHYDNRPIVVVDRDGQVGARAFDVFDAFTRRNDATDREFQVIGFQGGHAPRGKLAEQYRLNRDLMFGALLDWVRLGGSWPPDIKLEGELVSLKWRPVEGAKSALEHKSEVIARLGRSPDRLDSLALSTWRPQGWYTNPVDALPMGPPPPPPPRDHYEQTRRSQQIFNPYDWQRSFMPRGPRR